MPESPNPQAGVEAAKAAQVERNRERETETKGIVAIRLEKLKTFEGKKENLKKIQAALADLTAFIEQEGGEAAVVPEVMQQLAQLKQQEAEALSSLNAEHAAIAEIEKNPGVVGSLKTEAKQEDTRRNDAKEQALKKERLIEELTKIGQETDELCIQLTVLWKKDSNGEHMLFNKVGAHPSPNSHYGKQEKLQREVSTLSLELTHLKKQLDQAKQGVLSVFRGGKINELKENIKKLEQQKLEKDQALEKLILEIQDLFATRNRLTEEIWDKIMKYHQATVGEFYSDPLVVRADKKFPYAKIPYVFEEGKQNMIDIDNSKLFQQYTVQATERIVQEAKT